MAKKGDFVGLGLAVGLRAMVVPLNLSLTLLKIWLLLKAQGTGRGEQLKNAHSQKETLSEIPGNAGDLKVPGNEEKPNVDVGQGEKPGIPAGKGFVGLRKTEECQG